MLATFTRKQHLDSVQVLLCMFLAARGQPYPAACTTKSPAAISRFLNHYQWSLRGLIGVMRHHALVQFQAYRQQCRGRPLRVELIVDLTSLGKEGDFEGLGDWMQTLNTVYGVHVVVLYVCCGELRLPWSFLIWRGKGQPSPTQLALKLLRALPPAIRSSSKTVYLLADGGFCSKAFLQGVIALKLAGFVGMRGDRKIATGQHLRDLTSQGRQIELHDLPGVPLWVSWVWLPGKRGEAQERRLRSGVASRVRSRRLIVSTVRRSAAVMKRIGRRRWKIEALFKTLKSRFGFGKFGQHSKLGVLRFLCLSILSFLLCHFEELDHPHTGDPAWPDWGALAQQVRWKFLAWVRLDELFREIKQIYAVQDARSPLVI